MLEIRYEHITVTPQPDGFGAEITGLALAEPLPADVLDEVKLAWARHSVVCFPDQPLTLPQLEQFTRQFGEFGIDPFSSSRRRHRPVAEQQGRC